MEALTDLILQTFADAAYPGDDRLLDPDRGGWEADAAANLLRGRNWRDLHLAELRGYLLVWLTPEAFRYYLPAFLLAAVEEHATDQSRGLEVECIVNLAPTGRNANRLLEAGAILSPAECQAVIRSLEWFRAAYGSLYSGECAEGLAFWTKVVERKRESQNELGRRVGDQ